MTRHSHATLGPTACRHSGRLGWKAWLARLGWKAWLAGWALVLCACGEIDDPSLRPAQDPRFAAPPPALRAPRLDPQRTVFWGDLHIHTSYSYDAYTFGVRGLPDDAYRYAKGETIQHALGYPIRLSRPLDFAAVTDHAEYLGVPRSLAEAAAGDETALRDVMATGSPWRITVHYLKVILSSMSSVEQRERAFGGGDHAAASNRAWRDIIASAARHNDPGRFSAFLGYEWSSMPEAENLHRNVIYRTDRVPDAPFSSIHGEDPEDLWRALDRQRKQGMEMIAIPHNGNVSNGKMYDRVTFDGQPIDAAYAEQRLRNEPISEILQVKGQSEVHPQLAAEDEFADFEIYDRLLSARGTFSEPRGSYARDALKTGLEMSTQSGFNPYQFGVIGSSDGHNASSPVEEDQYHGKLPLLDGTAGLRLGESLLIPNSVNRGLRWSAMGLAAVWAEENTRTSLFDAMRRRETYATSGPRIAVRFFAGWDFDPKILGDSAVFEKAYATGVPMGGVLPHRAVASDGASSGDGTGAPAFIAMAVKDPQGANLDRIQVIKAWVAATGRSHERIYDIAASDGREPDEQTGRLPAVGNSVDLDRATYTNSIGTSQLERVWRDPDFDPSVEAFYYARVLEIPTPRWSTYDAVALGVAPPEPAAIQERAITSAIWYRPESDVRNPSPRREAR